jgi:hypothetical protein
MIEKMTGHSPNTITDYMKFYRELVIDTLKDYKDKIGGKGIIVKIDESKFGRRKYHHSRVIDGVWIIGGIERTEQK